MDEFTRIIGCLNFASAAFFFCFFLIEMRQDRKVAVVVDILFVCVNIFSGLYLLGVHNG